MNKTDKQSKIDPGDESIHHLDASMNEEDLAEEGIEISNLVASLRLNRELDLDPLSANLENTSYDPEIYPSMIYKPFPDENSVSVLTPSSGRLAIVGAKTKDELLEGIQKFANRLEDLGIELDKDVGEILIQNTVATYDLGTTLNLAVVATAIGIGDVEYEPEQFPGLIYRLHQHRTVSVFGSGKCVITGAKSYEEIVQLRNEFREILRDNGLLNT